MHEVFAYAVGKNGSLVTAVPQPHSSMLYRRSGLSARMTLIFQRMNISPSLMMQLKFVWRCQCLLLPMHQHHILCNLWGLLLAILCSS